jgi:hypothetical protein
MRSRLVAAECLHCGREFVPRKSGHVFCSVDCRHRGERQPHERDAVDQAAVVRLFDASRDPETRVLPDDWHPFPGSAWVELDAHDSVEQRRRWYRALVKLGRL